MNEAKRDQFEQSLSDAKFCIAEASPMKQAMKPYDVVRTSNIPCTNNWYVKHRLLSGAAALALVLMILVAPQRVLAAYPLTQDLNAAWQTVADNGFGAATSTAGVGVDPEGLYINSSSINVPMIFTASEGLSTFDLTSFTIYKVGGAANPLNLFFTGYKAGGGTVTIPQSSDVGGSTYLTFNDFTEFTGLTGFEVMVTNIQSWNVDMASFTIANPSTGSSIAPGLEGGSDQLFAENTVNATPQAFMPSVTATDADSTDFDGGQLLVTYTATGLSEDQLSVGNIGNITLSGSSIYHSGSTLIGVLSGGSNGSDLDISLNSNATPARTTDLLSAIVYGNSSHEPTSYRTVSVTVSDGDGATSLALSLEIAVEGEHEGTPTAPLTQDPSFPDWNDHLNNGFSVSITGPGTPSGDATSMWIEGGTPGTSAIVFTAAEQLTDGMFDLTGLTFDIYNPGVVKNFAVTITGEMATGGTVSASITGSSNAALNAISLSEMVGITSFSMKVTSAVDVSSGLDVDINNLGIDTFTIANVSSLNFAPTTTAPSSPTVAEDAANVALADTIHVTDSDGDDQTVTMTITGGTVTMGATGIIFGGSGNGSASFTADGTLTNINAALDAATFTPTANLNGINVATISFKSNDGTEDSSTVSVTFDISAVNDPPTFSSFAGAVDTTTQNMEVEITHAELLAQGDAADVDAGGTVDAFVVKTLSTGTLNIGTTAGSATAYSAITNDVIDATMNAYWTPGIGLSGIQNAFTLTAKDNDAAESTGSVQAAVMVIDHSAADLGHLLDTAVCVSCHAANDPMAVHANDCSSCHTAPPALRDPSERPPVTDISRGECSNCHTTYFNDHNHDHSLEVLANSASTPATVNCISCHTATTAPFVGGGEAHAASGCATCHDTATDGALKSPAVAGGGECVTCHTSLFDSHDHGSTGGNVDHTVVMGVSDLGQATSQYCSDCHAVLSWTNILTTHSSDCITCHNATRDINPATPTGTTVQDVINNANQSTVNCLDCHDDKAAPAVHLSADHSAAGLGHLLDTAMCVSCHAANDPMTVHSNNCSSCHTAPPNLRDPSERVLVTNISRGECSNCHTTYFNDHNHDHAATVTATSLCTSCHTGDVVALHNDCSSCHSSSDGSRIVGVNGYGDATVNGGAGGTCQDCHAAYYDAHTHDHSLDVSVNSASIPATVNCTYCHTATSAPFVGGGEVHESSGCATCHDTATDGGLKSPAVGGGGECVTCHTTLFDAHDHGSTGGNVDHTVVQGASDLGQATSQPCSDCHAVLSWTNILTTHSSDCITCHNATRDINPAAPTGTTVQDVITNANQSTVNCLDCHMDKAAPAVHLTADHSASGLGHLLDTAMCVSCHSANDPMAVHSSKCSNCHTTPPTLRDPSERVLVTDISRGACSDCHTTYFDDHLHDHAATVTATSLCTSCHTGDTGDTVTLHNDCNSCHSSSDNSLIVGVNGYGDATVNGGTGGTCQECHAAYYDAHIHDHSLVVLANSASVPATVNCISCHTTTTPPFVGGGEAHAANGCATCHDTATDGGLKSPAVVGGGECVTCHTSLFDAHDHGSTGGNVDHTVVMGAGDLGQAGSQPCSDCHAVLSWTNILTTHSSDCVTCHNATRDINPAAPVGTTVQDVITNANQSTVNCLDCHLDKAAPAVHLTADHSATGLAHLLDTAVCVSCHAVSDPMAVHSNNCSSCHTAPPTLRDPAERPLANSISRGECTECHTTYSADHNGSPPLIAVSTPADNATGVANIANLQIEFDKAVYAQSGNIILYKIVGDVLVESFDVTSAISGNGSTTISLNPAADLESLIDYYVQIDATAFDDNAGNSFAGISDKMTWNFTSADATLPTLVATIPVDNSIAIGANDDLVMNFTENMFSNAGNIVIYRSSDDSVFETIDITGGQVSIVANSVTVNPAGPFASATAYYIQIDNGAFEDASTNSWAGLSDKVSWNFTAADTDKPGVVISSTEGDPTINSPFSVTITFDEAVSGFVLGDIGVGNGTAGNLANTVANTTWTVEIVPIFEGVVTVDVNSSVAIDAAGNNNDAASQYSITYAPVDSDGDGLPDNYETAIGTDIGNNPTDDYDVDGFTDRHEYLLGLNPLVSNITDPDNDGDGISDLIEDMNGLDSTDPTDACADPDDDGIASNIELANGTSPVIDNALLADSDNDGIPDLTEWLAGLNPLVANSATDSDSDGLNDLLEYKYGTLITPNAFVVHSDSDGLPDFWEICLGLNPNDPDSDNDTSPDNIDIFPMDDTKICTGDINMNGTVEVVDAMLALRMSVGLVPENLLYGDVAPMLGGLPNPDTQINAADAMLILRKALGLVNW